jgi:hypothetical protein
MPRDADASHLVRSFAFHSRVTLLAATLLTVPYLSCQAVAQSSSRVSISFGQEESDEPRFLARISTVRAHEAIVEEEDEE